MSETTNKAAAFVIENWAELGIKDHNGVLLMPAAIKLRREDGSVTSVPVMLRNVSNDHRIKSRVQARQYAKERGLDLDRDRDLIDDIENYSMLSFAVRDATPPHDQHVAKLQDMLDRYDAQSLAELWGRYTAWVEMLDPRFGEMNEDDLWNTIVRIAREKNPGFLASIPGYAQGTCIVFMASQSLLSPKRPSWLQPPETFKAAS